MPSTTTTKTDATLSQTLHCIDGLLETAKSQLNYISSISKLSTLHLHHPSKQNVTVTAITNTQQIAAKQISPKMHDTQPPKRDSNRHPNDYILLSSDEEQESDEQDDEPPLSAHDTKSETKMEANTSTASGVRRKTPLQCLKCEQRFHFITEFDKHLIEEHNFRPYRCTQCSKTFKRKFNLNNHIRRVHNKERRFECNICYKKFFGKNDWQKHYNIHTNQGAYNCEFCSRRFVNKSMLECHRRKHTKERPFECPNCGRRFALKSNLMKHLERKNACSKADSISSMDSADNSENAKTHTESMSAEAANGENRPAEVGAFSCTECEQSFQFFNDFQTHLMVQHTYAHWKCTECNAAFVKRGNLTRHQRLVHNHEESQL